jgi:hypothetical protein
VQQMNSIVKMILQLTLLTALVLLVVVIVGMDSVLLEQGNSESSLTEFSQEACLLASIILFGFSAKHDVNARGFFVLVTGIFTTLLIREADAVLDNILHGFWLYPALTVSLASVFYARRCAGTVMKPLLEHMDSKNFAYIVIGLLITVVFSRTFGSGQFWREVMGEDYAIMYKSVIQEGLELLGYVFVLFGSLLTFSSVTRKKR